MNATENAPNRDEIVERALATLAEHFDCVQIMASYPDGRGTGGCFRGIGNWYARQGMAHEFINADVAQETATQIAARLK